MMGTSVDLPLRVLLVGYPAAAAAEMATVLTTGGMAVDIAATTAEALDGLSRLTPNVLVLNLDDAGPDKLAQIDQMAPLGGMGLIVVLAHDGERGRVNCLDRGADDVLAAATPPAELAARIRAIHRRIVRIVMASGSTGDTVLSVDAAHRCLVGPGGERTPLSEAEFIALETLLDADGAPVSRDWLGRVALKRPLHADDRSVDQLVLKLRRKLTAAGASDRTILSARRQGYMIADQMRLRSFVPGAEAPKAATELVAAGQS